MTPIAAPRSARHLRRSAPRDPAVTARPVRTATDCPGRPRGRLGHHARAARSGGPARCGRSSPRSTGRRAIGVARRRGALVGAASRAPRRPGPCGSSRQRPVHIARHTGSESDARRADRPPARGAEALPRDRQRGHGTAHDHEFSSHHHDSPARDTRRPVQACRHASRARRGEYTGHGWTDDPGAPASTTLEDRQHPARSSPSCGARAGAGFAARRPPTCRQRLLRLVSPHGPGSTPRASADAVVVGRSRQRTGGCCPRLPPPRLVEALPELTRTRRR